eukprot:TRINITY_DN4003_c0_g1_i1.p1 TRINITY_DN4003_c0_g1~~TRINITY_DN4003_c0_g1_i1.p1  ORF type:complete len:279 (+),score=59.40 TRINITY_DN4003_c0_g1_i1:32-868(+)
MRVLSFQRSLDGLIPSRGVSFWPQIWLNWKRKSVVGLSFDYCMLNLLGFLSLSTYQISFRYSDSIRKAYADAHQGKEPLVEVNDVVFAVHALAATILTIAQIFIYERGGQRISRLWGGIFVCLNLAVVGYLIFSLTKNDATVWMNFMYFLSMIKLVISTIKHLPQVYLNFKRKSTKGWSIGAILLDLTGGFLSIAQLLLNGWRKSDWDGVIGNPVKFGLGFVSILFDLVYLVQHYILYGDKNENGDEEQKDEFFADERDDEASPLIKNKRNRKVTVQF